MCVAVAPIAINTAKTALGRPKASKALDQPPGDTARLAQPARTTSAQHCCVVYVLGSDSLLCRHHFPINNVGCCCCTDVTLFYVGDAAASPCAIPSVTNGQIRCIKKSTSAGLQVGDQVPSGSACSVKCNSGYLASTDTATCDAGSFTSPTCNGAAVLLFALRACFGLSAHRQKCCFVLHEAEMDAFKVVVPCLATLCVFRLGIKMHAEQQREHV